MIHQITIEHAGHTYLYRFPAERVPEIRFRLAVDADSGKFPFDEAFKANNKLRQIQDEQMHDMETIKLRLIRTGFYPLIHGNADGWTVTLLHSYAGHELHRPPTGRAERLVDAMAAAEADLEEMLQKKKAKAG